MRVFYTILILSLLSCSSCTWDTRLVLINNTNYKIDYLDRIMDVTQTIPDTNFCEKRKELYSIEPQSKEIISTLNKWEYSLKNKPKKIFRLYIYSEDTLKKYGVCRVFKEQLFAKRYDLTYDDLQKLNWKIVYTGN